MNIEEMRLMKTEEEVRNRAKELLQMPKEEILTKYMFQEQEIEKLNNIINKYEEKTQMLDSVCRSLEFSAPENDYIFKGRLREIIDELKELKEKQ